MFEASSSPHMYVESVGRCTAANLNNALDHVSKSDIPNKTHSEAKTEHVGTLCGLEMLLLPQ